MRRLGFGDAAIAGILGYLPDLDMPASEIERHARELAERRRSEKTARTGGRPSATAVVSRGVG